MRLSRVTLLDVFGIQEAESVGTVTSHALPLFEIASVFVRLDHVPSFIVNANHGIMRPAAKLCVVDCIASCVWLAVPQANEWQRVGNQIDAAPLQLRLPDHQMDGS
jgi:hypothetical protein